MMNKIKRNKEEKRIPFIDRFSLKKQYESFPVFNNLLYKLAPEIHKRWTLKSLVHYISKVYEVANDLMDKGLPCLPYTSDGKYIFFNTGLVDKYYNDIYCWGLIPKQKEKEIVMFKGFWTKHDLQKQQELSSIGTEVLNSCKSVTEILQKKTHKAEYDRIKNNIEPSFPEEFNEDFFKMYCDVREKHLEEQVEGQLFQKEYEDLIEVMCEEGKDDIPECSRYKKDYTWRCFHLIIDGSDNIPISILKYMLTRLNNKLITLNEDDTKNRQKIIQDTIFELKGNMIGFCRCMYNMLKEAMLYSLKLSRQSNLIAPYYYIKNKDICFMLPLFLEHLEKPDCALVFDKDGNAKTLINMDEVYTDLRLIGRIDAYSWLSE